MKKNYYFSSSESVVIFVPDNWNISLDWNFLEDFYLQHKDLYIFISIPTVKNVSLSPCNRCKTLHTNEDKTIQKVQRNLASYSSQAS